MYNRLLAIVGPTGVGKSALALRLAERFDGEIVSADSRQVYRYMDVGTAKPSREDRGAVPHHLLDIVDPDEGFSLVLFLHRAARTIQDIQDRSKIPIVVGGTGQWVWGLLEGWQVPEVPPDRRLRRRLEERARRDGFLALHEELCLLDRRAASRIDPKNVRRVIRALEVGYASPEAGPGLPRKKPPRYDSILVGLTLPRCLLYRRIDCRVNTMVRSGWVDEVRWLLTKGYSPEMPSLSSLGYREIGQYLAGELAMDEAVKRIQRRTRGFARRQYGWFKPSDDRIRWFDGDSELQLAESYVGSLLQAQ